MAELPMCERHLRQIDVLDTGRTVEAQWELVRVRLETGSVFTMQLSPMTDNLGLLGG
jgi:hypothetical protein